MGRQRRQPEAAAKQTSGRGSRGAVQSADPVDGGKSLSQDYKEICEQAKFAQKLSRKNEVRWACDEYEAALELLSDAKKREDLTDYYRDLLEKAGAEIEKAHGKAKRRLLTEDIGESKSAKKQKSAGTIKLTETGDAPAETVTAAPVKEEHSKKRSEIAVSELHPEKRERRSTSTEETKAPEPAKETVSGEAATEEVRSRRDRTIPAEAAEQQPAEPTAVKEELSGPTVVNQASPEPKAEKEELPALLPLLVKKFKRSFSREASKKETLQAIGAIAIVLLLVLGVFAVMALKPEDKMSVTVPEKRIGDRVEYDVEGKLGADSKIGVKTAIGFLLGFNLEFEGKLWRQVNDTTKVLDGFDEEQDVLEEYLHQDLTMEGTVDFQALTPKMKNGRLVTHQVDYTSLRTKTLIRYYLSNFFTIEIPDEESPLELKPVSSIDKGTFYTGAAQSPTLMNFLDTEFQNTLFAGEITEGDSNKSEEYNLKWKACGKDSIAGYDSLKITVEELNPSDWFDVKLNYWVSSETPYPTKVELTGWIDTGELEGGALVSLLKVYLGGDSKLEVRYSATLADYQEGIQDIPYLANFGGGERTRHADAEFVDWYPDEEYRVPTLFAEGEKDEVSGFWSGFQADEAYEFAYNKTALDGFIKDHPRAFAVAGSYSIDERQHPVWDMTFGYFEATNDPFDLLDTRQEGRQVIVGLNENGSEPVKIDYEFPEILKPDRKNTDMREVVSLSSAEHLFLGFREQEAGVSMDGVFKTINVNGSNYEVIDFNSTRFEWESNAIGPTAGILGQYLPDSFEVPRLLGYHLIQNNTKDDENIYTDAMISGETGGRLYLRYHKDNFL